ncbi:hypothetical protein ACGFYU_05455 [Streptomyces sp. NPDC048337]|uniref:hypothetical protein n=1 Tax=Streptomyces sp. NPDC048337 TaxID=3365535 RepID=UPI003723FED0
MGRGKKTSRPATGIPQSVLVMPTAGGWARSIAGVGCGRPDPEIVDAAQAKAAAAESVTWFAGRHGMTVEIDWEPLPEGAWRGHVREGAAR